MLEDKMNEIRDIEIVYNPRLNNDNEVRIFGYNFVDNNKDKCKILYNYNDYELKEYFEEINNNYDKENNIILTLRIIDNIVDLSYMLYECYS